jgi:hypothetical protein
LPGVCKAEAVAGKLSDVRCYFTFTNVDFVQKSVYLIEENSVSYMPITLKQELIQKITATEDEGLLQLLLADIDYFSGDSKTDVTDELSPEDLSELVQLVKEPFGHETESYETFKKATGQWRTL